MRAKETNSDDNLIATCLIVDSYTTKKIRAQEEATEKASGDTVMEADEQDKEYPTLIRLTCGTKTKLSTQVMLTI